MSDALNEVWYTRCPVPTASGLAFHLGWLTDALGSDGLAVGILQDGPPELARHHFDHELVGLFREGGNVPALAARSEGAPSRLVGLTWIDEWQKILVRPDSGITTAEDLAGKRIALPAWAETRGASFPRAMALHGTAQALELADLRLADVRFVEVPTAARPTVRTGNPAQEIWGLDFLADDRVDAVYVKGAAAAEHAARHGLVVAVDLDAHPDRRFRVNNGTPRPITVHERILQEHPELVVKFLAESLRAADWAAENLEAVQAILQAETHSGPEGVATAYGAGFHTSLHPDLSDERLGLLARQKDFLYAHGFLAADFDLDEWVDPAPIAAAREVLAG
ncbi:MAG: hypothetical protein JWO68_3404, partial [Actinomycetia bacterium]|nr:hypothetical protein [Actinomycetes bacterium]